MKLQKYILLLPVIMLMSCEKEIDFKYHDIPEQNVIEGVLTQEGVSVKLTQTVATDEPFSEATITDANVKVTDIDNGMTYDLQANAEGIFTLSGLNGIIGHTYELTVKIGDHTYSSRSRMLPPTDIVSMEFQWIKMPYDDVAVLKVQFREDSDPETQYWLRVSRNGEPYEWQAIESRNAVNGLVTGMMMTSRKDIDKEDEDEVLKEGDVVGVEVMPISRQMADYLNSLNNGDYNGNRMFEGPYCLGYFLAAPIARTEMVYHPDRIQYAE